MTKYTDPLQNFKLIQATDSHPLTKRNMKIWDMLLNRLGLPDHLHEFVRGIYLAGNWDETEWDEITLLRIARNISSDDITQLRVCNRLKKNCPKFFDWQDQQTFVIIKREILTEYANQYKTKSRYSFLLYDLMIHLLNLPLNTSIKAIRKAVNEALRDYPEVEKPSRKPKRRRVKSVTRAIIRNINELIDLTGSPTVAALEISEEIPKEGTIKEFIDVLLQIKDLDPSYRMSGGEPFTSKT